jgi:hypothetical protein
LIAVILRWKSSYRGTLQRSWLEKHGGNRWNEAPVAKCAEHRAPKTVHRQRVKGGRVPSSVRRIVCRATIRVLAEGQQQQQQQPPATARRSGDTAADSAGRAGEVALAVVRSGRQASESGGEARKDGCVQALVQTALGIRLGPATLLLHSLSAIRCHLAAPRALFGFQSAALTHVDALSSHGPSLIRPFGRPPRSRRRRVPRPDALVARPLCSCHSFLRANAARWYDFCCPVCDLC